MNTSHGFLRVLALGLSIVLPMNSFAANCDALCDLSAANAQNMIADEKCKKDPACVDCVVQAAKQSQSGAQCTGYNLAKKAKTGEVINASINTAATVLCGTGCAVSVATAGVSGAAWDRACGFAGLAVTATEVGYTVANLIKGKDANILGLAGTALSAKGALKAVKKTSEEMAKKAVGTSCLNAVIFGVAAAAKVASISKMKKAADRTCAQAEGRGNSTPTIAMSCLNPTQLPTVGGGSGPGLFTATPQNFTAVKVDDVDRLSSTGVIDPFLKEMKPDFQRGSDEGKIDLASIGKRIESGEDVSSILADAGIPAGIIDAIKVEEGKIKAGQESKLLAAIEKRNGYTTGAGATTVAGVATGVDEFAYGVDAATPGEGAASMDIDRKPAGDGIAILGADGDVFHAKFGGSIFDIVSIRIKETKGAYAELEPAARMNRVFNGYSDPKRAPAASSRAKAKKE
jgi:hypothetical protein